MIISVLVGVYFALMGTVLIRRGAVNWRRKVSFAPRLRSLPFIDSAKASLERAFLTGGILHYLLAALMGVAAYLQTTGLAAAAARPSGVGGPAGATARPPQAVGILALVVLVGAAGSGCLLMVMTVFNRPRFLVPPHLRNRPETLAQRRYHPAGRTRRGTGEPPVAEATRPQAPRQDPDRDLSRR